MTLREVPRSSAQAVSYSPYRNLKTGLDALLPDSLFPPASIGIKVVSLMNNETLYEANPSLLFTPASNQKLFTCAAALAELGKDFQLNTTISLDTSASTTIYMKGFGDPLLSTSDIDSIASSISRNLPNSKPVRIVGDVSYFDDLYWGSGWVWDDEPDPDAMYVTPLSVNSNTIRIRVRPDLQTGRPVIVTTEHVTNFVSIENLATTSDSIAEKVKVSRKWLERSNVITVTGQMRPGDSIYSTTISVWKPEEYALTLLAERLQSIGFRTVQVGIDTVPLTVWEAMRISHRLDSVVTVALKESDNLAAENILKTLGAEKRGAQGTAATGLSVVKEFLSKNGIDTTEMNLADGSGVSRYNLASADEVVRVLQMIYDRKDLVEVMYNGLPVAGVDGSLKNRLTESPARGNLRAKTGTMRGVSSLSGYVQTLDGEMLAFSILMQGFIENVRTYRNVQDSIGNYLSTLKRERF